MDEGVTNDKENPIPCAGVIETVAAPITPATAPVPTPAPQPTPTPEPTPAPAPDPEPVDEVEDIQSASFSGRLLSSDGTPIANVIVALFSNPIITTTDNNGYFTFENVSIGAHILKVFMTQAGFDENNPAFQQAVTVSENADNNSKRQIQLRLGVAVFDAYGKSL